MRLLDASGTAELTSGAVGHRLALDGLVMIRQGSVGEVRTLLAEWTEPAEHPHDSELGLTIVAPQRSCGDVVGRSGFTRAPLAPHTDRSLRPDPPSVLAAVLISPAVSGGHAMLVDGSKVLAALRRSFPPMAIASLRLCAAGGVATPVITTREDVVSIRFRDDRVAVPCSTNGDQRVVTALRDAVSAETAFVPLGPGDGYILHNHRYLHGRSSFVGDRRLARMLAKITCGRLTWLNRGFSVAAS